MAQDATHSARPAARGCREEHDSRRGPQAPLQHQAGHATASKGRLAQRHLTAAPTQQRCSRQLAERHEPKRAKAARCSALSTRREAAAAAPALRARCGPREEGGLRDGNAARFRFRVQGMITSSRRQPFSRRSFRRSARTTREERRHRQLAVRGGRRCAARGTPRPAREAELQLMPAGAPCRVARRASQWSVAPAPPPRIPGVGVSCRRIRPRESRRPPQSARHTRQR